MTTGRRPRSPGPIIRDLLVGHPTTPATEHTRFVLYSGAGFAPELHRAADRGEATLVGLERLYQGE
jgi:hypothetical protein